MHHTFKHTKVATAANFNSFLQKKESSVAGFKSPEILNRPTPKIGSAGEEYEKEADTMADQIMRMPVDGQLNVSSLKSTGTNEPRVNKRYPGGNNIIKEVINSTMGKSLDTGSQSFMSARFNYDFGHVKIHDDPIAAKSASAINAIAYTSGNNIVFNTGQYDPGSQSGNRLLAHELTHVVQQDHGGPQTNHAISSAGSAEIIQRQPATSQANDPCSIDKLWGTWDATQEVLCGVKCQLPFAAEGCANECSEKYGVWAKLRKCRQEHPLPPTPDVWNETE